FPFASQPGHSHSIFCKRNSFPVLSGMAADAVVSLLRPFGSDLSLCPFGCDCRYCSRAALTSGSLSSSHGTAHLPRLLLAGGKRPSNLQVKLFRTPRPPRLVVRHRIARAQDGSKRDISRNNARASQGADAEAFGV